MADVEEQLDAMRREMDEEMNTLEADYDPETIRLDEYEISPYKKNIELDVFALGWLPHWLFTADGRTELAPAYTAE